MNVKQYAFVTAYLKHRDAIIAYKLATGSESTNLRSLQSAANRMLNKPGVREEIKSVLEATRAEVEAEIAETTRTELMTIQRKREILAQIINGQYTVMVRTKGKNCSPCTYFNSPTISQVLAGIREDNKMAGHYAVVTTKGKLQHPSRTKREITTTQHNVSPLQGDRGTLAPEEKPQHPSRSKREITTTQHNVSPPVRTARPGGLQGDRGTLAPEEKPQHPSRSKREITTIQSCPPLAGVSRSDGGGKLAPENCEMQQITTIPEPEKALPNASPLQGDRGTLAPDNCEMQQITTIPEPEKALHNTSPRSLSRPNAGGDRGTLEPDTRETQQITTTSNHEFPLFTQWRRAGGEVLTQGTLKRPSPAEAPAKGGKHKKFLSETTRLAQAPIPATLRPFFDACEMQHSATTAHNASPLQGDRGTLEPENEMQQLSEAPQKPFL